MTVAKNAAVKIAIICEGKTEQAFKPVLLAFLKTKLAGKMPKGHLEKLSESMKIKGLSPRPTGKSR